MCKTNNLVFNRKLYHRQDLGISLGSYAADPELRPWMFGAHYWDRTRPVYHHCNVLSIYISMLNVNSFSFSKRQSNVLHFECGFILEKLSYLHLTGYSYCVYGTLNRNQQWEWADCKYPTSGQNKSNLWISVFVAGTCTNAPACVCSVSQGSTKPRQWC